MVSSVILNPTLTESEFLELALLDFGFANVPASKAQRLIQLQEFLLRVKQAGKIAVLVIDEAHKVEPSVLEEVRLLSNLELPGEKLLQIVLAGQDELLATLERPALRQISQRVSVRLVLSPLLPGDVEHYIALRWAKAGATTPPPFTPDAYPEIARWSSGIPRLVNAVCDNALTTAFVDKPPVVAARHVREAARDLGLVRAVNEAVARSTVAMMAARPPAAPENGRGPVRAPAAPAMPEESDKDPWSERLSKWITRKHS